ncbi:MAG: hypothetical protein JXX14_05975 [Deltaproteobacteria bacterium]|nr:hypothetical protein [Deltaproteobacteria bacterium]
MNQAVTIGFFMFALLHLGCSISDDERCEEGMFWDDQFKACIESPETGIQGCYSHSDCTVAPLDYCLLDPTAPASPGMCTIDNCTAADCFIGSSCCDCSAVTFIGWTSPLCIPSDAAAQVTPLGCTCESGTASNTDTASAAEISTDSTVGTDSISDTETI